jgi:hypothetical protein
VDENPEAVEVMSRRLAPWLEEAPTGPQGPQKAPEGPSAAPHG